MKTIVPCPQCKKRGEWFETKYGPFCSQRCKLLDLGKWFSEENAISEPLRADHLEEYEDLEGPGLDRGEEKPD